MLAANFLAALTTFLVVGRLHDVVPTITDLLRIGGTAGASIGVSLEGEIIFTENFGYQDIGNRVEPTSTTVYTLGSLTKAFVSTVIAATVHDGVLDWHSPIVEHIPEFQLRRNASISGELNLIDLLSHRTDLIRKDLLWAGASNEVLVEKKYLLSVCNDLRLVAPVRITWLYNNWMYALAGEVLERATGQPFAELLEHTITGPLGLKNTKIDLGGFETSQLANPYIVGDDKHLFAVTYPNISSGSLLETVAGVKSNVNDLLTWTRAIMSGPRIAPAAATSTEPLVVSSTVLRGVNDVLSGRIVMSPSPLFDELYALGWAKVTLPATLGKIGFNPGLVSQMPTLGLHSDPELVYYHNGALPGFNHAIFMVPKRNLSIVVLTNSISQGDVADWIGQTLLQTALDTQPVVDFVRIAKEAAQTWKDTYPTMSKVLASQRINGTQEPAKNDLVGEYWHTSGAVRVSVTLSESNVLEFTVNDSADQAHELTHYHYDVYSFFPSRAERSRRGLITYPASAWLLHFLRDADGVIQALRWNLDVDEPDGERFVRRKAQCML